MSVHAGVSASARGTAPGRSRTPTIVDLLQTSERPLVSFELFPAKDETQQKQLWQTIRELESLGPDFVSVTYGASGSTRDRTITATEAIAQHTTLRSMAHLTCASQSKEQIRRVIGSYAAAGVRHVLAIRGDMPGGPTVPWEKHPEGLQNATELVAMVRELGDFCVGVAAFPDLHPERHDADLDARVLVAKAEAGAGFAITQLFFTAQNYFDLVARVRALGCDLPIIPGIMPVTRISQITRFAELSGAALPKRVTDRLHAASDDEQVRRVGVDLATELSEELLAGGAPGLHFITMNRSRATREIYARLHQALRRA
jgi:methylenetetrahydrofolate reductase (NADPH)